MRNSLLSQIIFAPLLAAVLIAAIPKRFVRLTQAVGGFGMLLTWALSCSLFLGFDPDRTGFQFSEFVSWIPFYGISYSVAVDGISLVLILLTTTLSCLALLASYRVIQERVKEFVLALLALETTMVGTFAAVDLFLFYVFWEAVLIPMYFVIGVWGGPRRIYATLKFFLYTAAGSVLMLVGILALYSLHKDQFGTLSTAMTDLYRLRLPVETQITFFVLFALAFAIKIPIFPFHTWLPDAHVEAPTAGSVLLAAILLKLGGYGFFRLALPLFPAASVAAAPYLAILGIAGILYGAFAAWAQEDVKKLVAYSSVSHMGFVVLGIASLTPSAMAGAVFQMVAHGVSTGALFLLVGVLYERRHTRMLADFGGLAKVTPRLATAFLIITLTSIGLPGLAGFVGEFLVLTGTFRSTFLPHPGWLTAFASVGIVLGAAYMLAMYERVFLGEVKFEENRLLQDLNLREGITLLVPVLLALWLGLKPGIVLSRIETAVLSIQRTATSGEKVSDDREGDRP